MTAATSKQDPLLLIDGYNLLFESGFVPTKRTGRWLKDARQRLVHFVASKIQAETRRRTHVVFDASRVRSRTEPSYVDSSGIVVTFAIDHREADDLIEEIIRTHSHPKKLRVISSDQRIRRKASARRAVSIPSDTYMDELFDLPTRELGTVDIAARDKHAASSTPLAKPAIEDVSDDEIEHWLREFGSPRE